MLSETSSADVAMLVVDTSTDNFERGFCKDGQTREHSILARSLGISKILVAMNKMDSTKWSKTRFDQIEKTLDHFLKSIGYKSTLFVPVSGLEGHNLVRSYTECDWYTGPTLTDAINSIKPVTRDLSRPVRLLVSGREHSFKYGNVVLGKIAVGSLMVGEKLVAMPLNMAVQVKSIRCGEKEVVVGIAGENVEAAFGKETTLETGFVVCDQMNPVYKNGFNNKI
ncbi:hypothetical protein MHBO_002199 [Bonamia ostreae]|uniref:Tr-type G domain-containing protein n=1 Tax=Bonamia ostreae TaxID=126728 RepID=A0ABV2ALJ6_9EUKA